MTTRHSVGLALSGGGARGLAHIGVLKVLEREAIPRDLLAGTSMGGLVATMSAAGMSALDLEREARRMACVRRMVPLIDPTIRQRGILSGQRVAAYLRQHLGDRTFDDLDIPLALTAVDILSQREVILTRGRLVDAVRATTAIPGLFAPVQHGNRLLVDGGVLNGLPTDVARTMGADVVIAVDVRTPPRPDLFSHIAARPSERHASRDRAAALVAVAARRDHPPCPSRGHKRPRQLFAGRRDHRRRRARR